MTDNPLVSIIITNYNYGRFLQNAIESARNQTYPFVEVIVVDDGSTDNSREIIYSYGDGIVSLFKDNAGQASAFNAGFARSAGEIVIFLDSDDFLLLTTIARVVEVFRRQSGIGKVQYPLTVTDASGEPIGEIIPPRPMPSGDLCHHVLKYYTYTYPPTSGNAFASKVLRRCFPIPEEYYRISADMYLADLSVLLGPVVSLNEVGGFYRKHGTNQLYSITDKDFRRREDVRLLRELIQRWQIGYEYQQNLAQELGMIKTRGELFYTWDLLNPRMSSLKLDPDNHFFRHDTLIRIACRGIMTAFTEPVDYFYQRVLRGIWFIGMLLLPRKYASALVANLHNRMKHRKLDRLLARLRRKKPLRVWENHL